MGPGYFATRQNLRPFVMIQVCALGLLIAYYSSQTVRDLCETLVATKKMGGILASGLVALVAGGIVPEFAKALAMGDRTFTRDRLSRAAFAMLYFFIAGMMIDLFYRAQAIMFGSGTDMVTSLKKMAFDQFVYSVFWAVPFTAVMFCWHANGLSCSRAWNEISDRFVSRRVLPVLLPAWAYWIPMNMITYLLPVPVQFLMFTFALAAWSLILTIVAGAVKQEQSQT